MKSVNPIQFPASRTTRGTRTWWLLLLVSLLGMAWEAQAKAILNLRVSGADWRGRLGSGYEVFDTTPYSQSVTFTVDHQGSACDYFVTLSKDTPGNSPRLMTGGTESLGFQIYDTPSFGNVLKDLPLATSNEVVQGRFGSGNESHQREFVFTIPALQVVSGGTYSASVRVDLYEGNLGTHEVARTVTIQLRARVLESLDLAVLASGQGFTPGADRHTLDFGELTQGKSLGLDLKVRSNAGYSVRIASEQGGLLKLKSGAPTDSIPYRLELGQMPLPLTKEPLTAVVHRGGATPILGTTYPLRVTIGDLANPTAGDYQDVLTVTVQTEK